MGTILDMNIVYQCTNPLCGNLWDRDPGTRCPTCSQPLSTRVVRTPPAPKPAGEPMPGNCPRRPEDPDHVFRLLDQDDVWRLEPDGNRTCSYCGGMHPEDVIHSLQRGWRYERTDMSYKGYLIPVAPAAAYSPMPKFYTPHFTREQIDRVNAAIAKQRKTS